jgi:hypothetical protein
MAEAEYWRFTVARDCQKKNTSENHSECRLELMMMGTISSRAAFVLLLLVAVASSRTAPTAMAIVESSAAEPASPLPERVTATLGQMYSPPRTWWQMADYTEHGVRTRRGSRGRRLDISDVADDCGLDITLQTTLVQTHTNPYNFEQPHRCVSALS